MGINLLRDEEKLVIRRKQNLCNIAQQGGVSFDGFHNEALVITQRTSKTNSRSQEASLSNFLALFFSFCKEITLQM